MMESVGDSDYYQELYNRFRTYLQDESSGLDFSEDEYVDVFDYAGDISDSFVQTEVLFRALSKFPFSRRLNERKMLYYMDSDDESGALSVARSLPKSSFLAQLVKIRYDGGSEDSQLAKLDDLIESLKPHSLEDEDVIQLVRLVVGELFKIRWIEDNLEKLKSLSEFPSTILFEFAQALMDDVRNDDARAIAQELTMLEPFNFSFWSLLAEIEGDRLMDYESALQSLDYALAIDPTPRKELLMKAHFLSMSKAPWNDVENVMTGILESTPGDSDLRFYYVSLCREYGLLDKARAELKRCFDGVHDKRAAIEMALELHDGNFPEWVTDRMLAKVLAGIDSDVFEDMLYAVYSDNHYEAAMRLMDLCYDASMMLFADKALLFVEMLYRLGRYDEVISRVDSYYEFLEDMAVGGFGLPLVYALSRLRMRHTDGLVEFIDKILSTESTAKNEARINMFMRRVGFSMYLIMLKSYLGGEDVAENAYDPFVSWS